MERLASLALVLHSGDASGRGGRGSGLMALLGKNDGKPQRLLASKLKGLTRQWSC